MMVMMTVNVAEKVTMSVSMGMKRMNSVLWGGSAARCMSVFGTSGATTPVAREAMTAESQKMPPVGSSSPSMFPRELPTFAYTPPPYVGPSPEEALAARKSFLSPCLFHHFKEPVMITHGRMQYLFDHTGRRFLDCFAGIVTVSAGHCHPEINAAVDAQNAQLQHTTTIYLNPEVAMYGKEMAAKMPGDLKVCYFVNSGSEANDLAVLMARLYTGNFEVIALRNCYHGTSQGTMGLTAHSTWKYNTQKIIKNII